VLRRQCDDQIAMNKGKVVGHHDDACIPVVAKGGDGAFNPRRVLDRPLRRLHSERGCCCVDQAKILSAVSVWIEYEGGASSFRRNLLEQLQPFAAHPGFEVSQAGQIATRICQALNKTAANRVGNVDEYDWYSIDLAMEYAGCRCAINENHAWSCSCQLDRM
jgi:hypothetical protein